MTGCERDSSCVFCGLPAVGTNKAREHIIKRAWLEKLDLMKFMVNQMPSTNGSFRPVRPIRANGILAGQVCRGCNSGWMDQVDGVVNDVMLQLATRTLDLTAVPDELRWPLARWALKCACALESTTFFRHIPEEVRQGVMVGDWRPDSMVLFAGHFGENAAAPCLPGIWPTGTAVGDYLQEQPQSSRLKFSFSVGEVVFAGCYLLNVVRVAYSADLRLLHPIFLHGSDVVHADSPQDLFEMIPTPEGMIPGPGVVAAAMVQPIQIGLRNGQILG